MFRHLVVCAFFLLVHPLPAYSLDRSLEASVSAGYTDNLVKDSSNRTDSYTDSRVDLNLYPLPQTEITASIEYLYYSRNFSLSNLSYGGGMRILPLPESSPLSVFVEGNYESYDYKESSDSASQDINRNEFPASDFDARISIGYEVSSASQVRAGFRYTSKSYSIEEVSDRTFADYFVGANYTLLGRFAFDLEAGLTRGDFDYLPRWRTILVGGNPVVVPNGGINDLNAYSKLDQGSLHSYYISPRISTSVGNKTGVSATFSYREFTNKDRDRIVYGYSAGYLSPWVAEYSGTVVLLQVKTYLIPSFIVTVRGGYWDKGHQATLEADGGAVPITSFAVDRADERRRIQAVIQFPIATRSGFFLEPSLNLDYTSNSSNISVYDYRDFTALIGIKVRSR